MLPHLQNDSDEESCPGYELVINNVPEDTFSNAYVKEDLETLFRSYGSHAQFRYVDTHRRVFVLYLLESHCDAAKKELDGYDLDGCILQVSKLKQPSSTYFLRTPQTKKDFLISPPISPPAEGLPGVGGVASLALQAAIATLGGVGSSFELHPGDTDKGQPKIVVTQD